MSFTPMLVCFLNYNNVCPYQNRFGEETQYMSGIVTTAEYNIVYNIVYIFLVHISVHLDMLNKIIVHLYSESMIVYMHGNTIFTSDKLKSLTGVLNSP